MNLIKSFKNSVVSIWSNKIRSLLTMLGIIIGVGAVIIIMSIGAGAQSLILAQIKSLGTNIIGVFPGSTEDGMPATAMGIVITTLKYDDLKALKNKKNVPNLVDAVGYTKGVANISWRANSQDANLAGCTNGYLRVEGGEVAQGRFFSELEERNFSKVVVLGSTVKEELFGDHNAVGQKIKIKKHGFEVIGVMEERGQVAFQDYDNQIFVPIKTMQKLIAGVDHLGLIRMKVDHKDNLARAIRDVAMTMRAQHDISDPSGKEDDFTIRNAAQALDMITVITDGLKYFLAAVAALSLVVGGIGIMNIMFINISERTREIGLRKAVGARQGDILSQFLIETINITLIGGAIGILGGILISFLIYLVAQYLGYDWEFLISYLSIGLALLVSVLVGLIFGAYPAYKASCLEPVEALRYE